MGTYDWLLVVAALLPALVLCIYIFIKDRVEKEPLGLLLLLLGLGALGCYPAAEVEGIIIGLLDELCIDAPFFLYNFLKYFIGVALVEEGIKCIVLNCATWRNTEFNCLFDGLIYAIFASLGFAALENVFYVMEYGFGNALMRALLSVPGHMFFAVLMGYYYSLRHITVKAKTLELQLKELGMISEAVKPFSSKKYVLYSILVPTLAHGFYNYCCTYGTAVAMIVFYAFVVFMYVYCFGKIRKMSKADAPDGDYAKLLLIRKYPQLAEYICTQLQDASDA